HEDVVRAVEEGHVDVLGAFGALGGFLGGGVGLRGGGEGEGGRGEQGRGVAVDHGWGSVSGRGLAAPGRDAMVPGAWKRGRGLRGARACPTDSGGDGLIRGVGAGGYPRNLSMTR